MTLYRTYRSQTFAQVVGQDHIKRTLENALTHNLVAHGYLFAGPRGSGKTSVARILAMAVNCLERDATKSSEPCGACQNCVDIREGRSLAVVEIDAASNRGIDEIRALRETIRLAPGAGTTKKVYIIDEVHMLTKEAFNALLKTLEEPPAHALFVLATTELHKVPDTIISRVQHFSFRRGTPAEIRSHLKWVAEQEKLAIDEAALELVVLHADGAFRDALSLLGQLQSLGESPITVETVRVALGVAPEAELCQLIAASFANEPDRIHDALTQFVDRGYDPSALIDDLILLCRSMLWQQYGIKDTLASNLPELIALKATPVQIVSRIEALLTAKQQLRWSPLPFLPVELALIPIEAPMMVSQATAVVPQPAPVVAAVPPKPEIAIPVIPPAAPKIVEPIPEPELVTIPDPPVIEQVAEPSVVVAAFDPALDPAEIWKKVIPKMQGKNASLAALLKASTLISMSAEEAVVGVPFNFYADRIMDRKNMMLLSELLAAFGMLGEIRCQLSGQAVVHELPAQSPTQVSPPIAARTTADVEQDVRDIFGVAEEPQSTASNA